MILVISYNELSINPNIIITALGLFGYLSMSKYTGSSITKLIFDCILLSCKFLTLLVPKIKILSKLSILTSASLLLTLMLQVVFILVFLLDTTVIVHLPFDIPVTNPSLDTLAILPLELIYVTDWFAFVGKTVWII